MSKIAILKERILQYLEYKSISKYECYQKTGITNGIFSKKEGLSEDNLLRFISEYSDISFNWLLTGEGEMLRDSSEQSAEPSREDRLLAIIESQQDTIKELSKKIK